MQRMLRGGPAPFIAALLALALGACGTPNNNPDAGDSGTPADTGGGTDVVTDRGPAGDTGGSGCAAGEGIGPCNPVTQTGCMTGQACIVAGREGGGVESSCAAPGRGGNGAPCMNVTQCLEGFACLGGACRKLCCGMGDDERCRTGTGAIPGGRCSGPIRDVSFMLCVGIDVCDWFAQDCTMGRNCLPTAADGTTQCIAAGMGTDGSMCMGPQDCARGHTCIRTSMTAPPACRRICDPSGAMSDAGTPDGGVPRACPTGFRCGGVMGLPENFGVCIPMM